MSLLLIKISPPKFQEMLKLKASSFLLFKYLNFDFYTLYLSDPGPDIFFDVSVLIYS